MIDYKLFCHVKEKAQGREDVALVASFFPISLSATFLHPCFQQFPLSYLFKTPTSACLYSRFPGGNQVLFVSSGHFPLTFKGKSQQLKNY
jgi:hypothetical protein